MDICLHFRLTQAIQYIAFFRERSISIETLRLLIGAYPILTVKYDYKMSRVCTDGTDGRVITVAVYISAQ